MFTMVSLSATNRQNFFISIWSRAFPFPTLYQKSCAITSVSSSEVQSPRPIFQLGKAHLVHLLSSTIVRRSIDASVVSRGPTLYERKESLGYEALDIVVTDFIYHARGKDDSPKSNEYSLSGHIFRFAIVIQSLTMVL
ncbi:hypothetical protein GYMLUDRAFT_414449 [Collybiopsis luxurians FD-317 M1]|nr:hypothetical protein GYMLUDRAFT_414449 [Collybiopsis luxurians FD-317 M1]